LRPGPGRLRNRPMRRNGIPHRRGPCAVSVPRRRLLQPDGRHPHRRAHRPHPVARGERKAMKTMRTLLLIGALGAPSPLLAQSSPSVRQPLLVHDVTGNLNIFQSTPVGCSDFHKDVAVSGGWFHLTPAEGADIGGGNRSFVLSRGTVTVHPFKISV